MSFDVLESSQTETSSHGSATSVGNSGSEASSSMAVSSTFYKRLILRIKDQRVQQGFKGAVYFGKKKKEKNWTIIPRRFSFKEKKNKENTYSHTRTGNAPSAGTAGRKRTQKFCFHLQV